MATLIKDTLILVLRFLLWCRYRVDVRGLEAVKGLKRTLILPNHPAYVDPPVVIGALWSALRPRPMLDARMFENPLLFWIPKAINAVKVPDLGRQSSEARARAEQTIQAVIEGLERGENFILWPAGHVQPKDREFLGSTRSVSEILSRVPDVNVALVRTLGLRGSLFSYSRTASKPKVPQRLLEGFAVLIANLFVFTPRRRVEMTIERVGRESLPGLTREELNPFLEAWYNERGLEETVFVPYHFAFGPRSYEFPPMPESSVSAGVLGDVKPETKTTVSQILVDKLSGREAGPTTEAAATLDSLGLDSLDRAEISLAVEERFGFRGTGEVPATVGDLWVLAEGLADSAPAKPPPEKWFEGESVPDEPASLLGPTIPEAFVRRAVACRKDVVAADDLSGVVTYERFLVGSQAMARQFEKIAAQNVGIMLPASVATDIVIFAVQLAGKMPVLLNWTTGPGNLAHAAKTMELTHVVTSKRFVDRLAISVDGTADLYLEDVRRSIGKLELLLLLLRTRLFPNSILRRLPSRAPEDPAVVLFTSGSEKAPKAVPLTHQNILSNIQSVLDGYDMRRRDVILGFLPAFHSFGVTVTSMMPILAGFRVVHHPDPTDSGALARKLASYKSTIVCATPTFLSYILNRCKPGDLVSLKWAVVGAEKCPESVFKQFAGVAPDADLLEGYGITECAPLVCCNRPGDTKPGTIGLPIPGVELKVVHSDTFEPLSDGDVGMLLVCGKNVFPGYFSYDGPSPFRELNGKRWYVTGDLARVDEGGFYHFSGRLKRFLKAGGEMISLPAIEEPFVAQYPPTDDGPRVAVEGIENESGRRIVLFTTEEVDLTTANGILKENGFRGVMRLDEVRRVEEIPVLGTGKIDYKVLRGWLSQPAHSP